MKKIFAYLLIAMPAMVLLVAASTQKSGEVTTSKFTREALTNETAAGWRSKLGVTTNGTADPSQWQADISYSNTANLVTTTALVDSATSDMSAAITAATNPITLRGVASGAASAVVTNSGVITINAHGEDVIDENSIGFIRGTARQVITKNRFSFTDATYGHNPGTSYGQMWLRDWTLARDGILDAISLEESASTITTWSNQFFASRSFPDFIDSSKTSLFDGYSTAGGKILPSLDVPFDFMHALYQDYLQRGNAMMFSNNWVVASNAMNFLGWSNNAYVPLPGIAIRNELVYSTNTLCINAVSVGITNYGSFGFHDAIPKRGYDLWVSLVRYRALKEAAELCAVTGQRLTASNLQWRADTCASNLVTYVWSATNGWFLSATETNAIADPLGSAYAVWLGATDPTKTFIIASNAAACSPGGALWPSKFCITNGAVMIPGYGNYWQWAPFAGLGSGQNGTAWQGFAGIWNYAVGIYSPAQARSNWREFVAFTRSSTNQPFLEFFGPSGAGVYGSWSYMQGAQALQYFNRVSPRASASPVAAASSSSVDYSIVSSIAASNTIYQLTNGANNLSVGTLTATSVAGNGAGLTNGSGLGFATLGDIKSSATITPWATGGSGSTSSVPVVVWKRVIQGSNQMHNAFPTADVAPDEIRVTWSQGTNHAQKSTGVGMLSTSKDGGLTFSSPVTNFNAGWFGIGPGTNWGVAHYAISTMRDGTMLEWSNIRTNGNAFGATNILRESRDKGVTWRTNSYPYVAAFGNYQMCNAAVHETPGGAWLTYIFDDNALDVAFLRSTNRGVTWTANVINTTGGNETGFGNLGSEIYANVRYDGVVDSFLTYRSLDDGITWSGPFTNFLTSSGGVAPAHPYTEFLGKRMYVTARGYDLYWTELLWFDDYPYYTNLTGRMVLEPRPSLYCSIKKLSENVLIAVSANANEPNSSTFGSTNADITAFIVAQDGVGWNMSPKSEQLQQPYISLLAKDLPYRASGFTWPNGGTLSYDLTNANTPTLSLTNGVKLASSGNAAGFRFIVDHAIPFHSTNQFTIIWTGKPTNTANYAPIFDANVNGTASTGLRMYFDASAGIQTWQGKWVGGSWAGNYLSQARPMVSDPLYNRRFGVYAVRLSNDVQSVFYNGTRFSSYVANTGVGGYTNAGTIGTGNNASITYALLGGNVNASAAQGVLMSNIRLWTNSLSDSEIAERSAEQYRDAFLNLK